MTTALGGEVIGCQRRDGSGQANPLPHAFSMLHEGWTAYRKLPRRWSWKPCFRARLPGMEYAAVRREALPIGSANVEATCPSLVTVRMKRPGVDRPEVYTPPMGHAFSFFADTYDTERIKILSVWSQFSDDDLGFRPAALSRTPLEQMVHQCASEDVWMRTMLQIDAEMPVLPSVETRVEFLAHYAAASGRRLEQLRTRTPEWFTEEVAFFDVRRSRAWVLLRRIAHSAHHRGQLTVYLRLLGRKLYSTYGPTADTGGLFQNQAEVIYRYDSVEELLSAELEGGRDRPLPGPGAKPPTERP